MTQELAIMFDFKFLLMLIDPSYCHLTPVDLLCAKLKAIQQTHHPTKPMSEWAEMLQRIHYSTTE